MIKFFLKKRQKKSSMMLILFVNMLLYLSHAQQLLIINSCLSRTQQLDSFLIKRKGWLIHLNPKSYKFFILAARDLGI